MSTGNKGFTLIELIIVIVLLGIIGGTVVFFTPLMNMYFFLPAQARTEHVGTFVINAVAEGDSAAKGLRIMNSIEAGADTSLTYRDADGKSVLLSWSGATYKLTRTTSTETEVLPKQYPGNDVKLDGQTAGIIFKYYDSSNSLLGTPVAVPANIARVQMDWIFYTGTAAVGTWGTKFKVDTGVFVKQF